MCKFFQAISQLATADFLYPEQVKSSNYNWQQSLTQAEV